VKITEVAQIICTLNANLFCDRYPKFWPTFLNFEQNYPNKKFTQSGHPDIFNLECFFPSANFFPAAGFKGWRKTLRI
jgi:hypothetical protein